MLYELREYRIRKGRMKQWLKLFEGEIVPFQVSKGMVIPASFIAVEDPDLFIWLRRFASEAERTRLYRKVYETDRWEKDIQPKVDEVLDVSKIVMTRLSPTARSALH
jgi:hypothetical protein